MGGSSLKYVSAPSVRKLIQNEPPIEQSQQRDYRAGHGRTLRSKVIVHVSMSSIFNATLVPPVNHLSLFHVQRHIRRSLMLASSSRRASRWSVTTKFSRVKLPVNSKSAPSSWSELMRSIVIILRSLPLSANGASCPQEGCRPSFYTTWYPSFIWERLFPRKYLK